MILLLAEFCTILGHSCLEVRKCNLTLILLVTQGLQFLYHFRPLCIYLLKHSREQRYGLILVHLLVNLAVILVVLRGLEALRVVARRDFTLLRFVLAEVKTFCREHFRTDRQLEVFVRDKSISIHVKVVEAFLGLPIGNVHAPEVEEESEFSN